MSSRSLRFFIVLLVIYSLPIVTYVFFFGVQISFNHSTWAEFGSSMSGVYAPIAAISTLFILCIQVEGQSQMNEHQYALSHVQQARSDIEFYSVQLTKALERDLRDGKTVRQFLHAYFEPLGIAELDQVNLRKLALEINAIDPFAMGLWFAIYPILAGLEAGKGVQFEMTLASSVNKLIAMLSFETCVALDNFHRVCTQGQIPVSYKFSPLFST